MVPLCKPGRRVMPEEKDEGAGRTELLSLKRSALGLYFLVSLKRLTRGQQCVRVCVMRGLQSTSKNKLYLFFFLRVCPKQTASHDKVLVERWSEQVTDGRLYWGTGDKLICYTVAAHLWWKRQRVRKGRSANWTLQKSAVSASAPPIDWLPRLAPGGLWPNLRAHNGA